jgi:hypothetical protein
MNTFFEYLKNLQEEFRNNDYRYITISPPADLDLPVVYQQDWGIDFDYIRGQRSFGVTGSVISFVATREVFRELGLLLMVLAVRHTYRYVPAESPDAHRMDGFWIRIMGSDTALLINEGCSPPMKYQDFPVTGVHYTYASNDEMADRRALERLEKCYRPSFGYYEQTKDIRFDFTKIPAWVSRAVYIGSSAASLLRLGGALLDFSHPEGHDAAVLELEDNFEQVGVHSYDAHFFIAGSEPAYLVFGYDTGSLSKDS